MRPKYYSQYDKPWNIFLYPSQELPKANIQSSGCGPTCFAMVRETLQKVKYTPIDAAKDSLKLGDRVNGGTSNKYFPDMAKKYKLSLVETSNLNRAILSLRYGKLVICLMHNWFGNGGGHFIVLWQAKNGRLYINDSASRTNTNLKTFPQSLFIEKCSKYFIFSNPDI
ncbi:MAG: C39 family peptidase [Clostridia bacterium]|jgi:ABC-type bacteriocin/lantibiotic exporter with double-glycine peptidase domain